MRDEHVALERLIFFSSCDLPSILSFVITVVRHDGVWYQGKKITKGLLLK